MVWYGPVFPGFFIGETQMNFNTVIQLLIGIVFFGIWTFVVFYIKPEMLDSYMSFVVFIVSGLIGRATGHATRDVLPSKDEPKQEEVKQ